MGVTTACFESEGIAPSAIDLLIRMVSGFAISDAPSLSSRAGMFSRPVDLDDLTFFSSLQTKSSGTSERRKTLGVLRARL